MKGQWPLISQGTLPLPPECQVLFGGCWIEFLWKDWKMDFLIKLNPILSRRISHFFSGTGRWFCNPVWPWRFCLKLNLFVPWVIIFACIVDRTSPPAGEICAQKHPFSALPVSLPYFSTVFECWSWPRKRYNYLLCLTSSTVLEKRVLFIGNYNPI